MLFNFFGKLAGTSHGGAKVPGNKNTAGKPTEQLFAPLQTVYLPLLQHIGAACKPLVTAGDRVYKGQKIGDSDAFISAPLHSSVSGTVQRISGIKMPNGGDVAAVIIKPDGRDELFPNIEPPKINDRASLLKAVRESGAVGLGGAGFPTAVKLAFPQEKSMTLIVNGAECEPYITTDNREILENTDDIIKGILFLAKYLNISSVIIGVERNKPRAIAVLEEAILKNNVKSKIKVKRLRTKYPQGAEKMLIFACTGLVLPIGSLPSNIGCLVMNVTTIGFLNRYFNTGIPLIRRRVTVDGTAVKNPKNLFVPVGTPIANLLDACQAEDFMKLILGGPMMGVTVASAEFPILKQNNALLAFGMAEADLPEETGCINCGRCNDSCPMMLSPVRILRAAKNRDFNELERLRTASCIECGCCTYNCPAKRYITQQMRMSKIILGNHRKETGGKS